MPTYMLVENGRGIRCLRPGCGLTSWHPDDVRRRYCGRCHVFHDDLAATELLRQQLGAERPSVPPARPLRGRVAAVATWLLIAVMAAMVVVWLVAAYQTIFGAAAGGP